jgi:hypothetical protein
MLCKGVAQPVNKMRIAMSVANTLEYGDVLSKIRSWPPELRIKLTEDVLRSLQAESRSQGRHGLSAEQVRGIGAGKGPPPDDETVKQWLDEYRRQSLGF